MKFLRTRDPVITSSVKLSCGVVEFSSHSAKLGLDDITAIVHSLSRTANKSGGIDWLSRSERRGGEGGGGGGGGYGSFWSGGIWGRRAWEFSTWDKI